MAADWLMLTEAARAGAAFVRTYGWSEPAATFGYTQRQADIAALTGGWQLSALIRRPSAGGLVDHRDDWTFALAVPRAWPLAGAPPAEVYAQVHGALAAALRQRGVAAELAGEVTGDPLQCFVAPVRDDLIEPGTGRKLAGAALKRSREGLLLQGSLLGETARAAEPEALEQALVGRLSGLLQADAAASAWLPEGEQSWPSRVEKLSGEAWNHRR